MTYAKKLGCIVDIDVGDAEPESQVQEWLDRLNFLKPAGKDDMADINHELSRTIKTVDRMWPREDPKTRESSDLTTASVNISW